MQAGECHYMTNSIIDFKFIKDLSHQSNVTEVIITNKELFVSKKGQKPELYPIPEPLALSTIEDIAYELIISVKPDYKKGTAIMLDGNFDGLRFNVVAYPMYNNSIDYTIFLKTLNKSVQ